MSEIIEMEIVVEREIVYKEDSNWGLYAAVLSENQDVEVKYNEYGNISIKGILPRLESGGIYTVVARKETHLKFGTSYNVQKITQDLPATPKRQRDFLSSLLTEKQVDNIFAAYGEDENIIEMIQNDSFDYKKIRGLGEFMYGIIRKKIVENVEMFNAISELHKYDLKPHAIKQLVDKFGSEKLVVEKIKSNPYTLTAVSGWGFKRVDPIAIREGYAKDGEFRIDSGVKYLIEENQMNGHTWMKKDKLLNEAVSLLSLKGSVIEERLNAGIKGVKIVDECICLKKSYEIEKYISSKLLNFQNQKGRELKIDVDDFLNKYEEKTGFKLTDEQRQFFHNFKNNNVNFLVGFAGCGKSALQKILIEMLDSLGMSALLVSPTGKAAKVLSNYIGKPASTVHRAAGIISENDEGKYDIYDDVILVDEISMAGSRLFGQLLYRIKGKMPKLLFVGDPEQLPAVGYGSVLSDCIKSNKFAVSTLTQVFRQKEGGILDVATKTRHKEKYLDDYARGKFEFGKDMTFYSVESDHIEKGILFCYHNALKKYNKEDILILSPTKKGKFGTYLINKRIQDIVNPHSDDKNEFSMKLDGQDIIFREGDNVLNIKNKYKVKNIKNEEVDIVNGDSGVIEKIDKEKNQVIVDFEFTKISFKYGDMKDFLHNYCVTLHKSQGDSSLHIIMVTDRSHKFQLNNNLVYTGITRSKEYLEVISQAETINYAMRRNAVLERKTFLYDFLVGNID